jgi:acetylornithine deacetylase/succinyl-diaminopimelate desuccinylase-like protein
MAYNPVLPKCNKGKSMITNRDQAIEFARNNKSRFENNLIELVKIPSVSTDPELKWAMQQTAENLVILLKTIGFKEASVYSTPGHPVVFGQTHPGTKSQPVLLIYGHYDVQPPDPLDLWKSKPFEPTQMGDRLYGRGTSDMKGQICASLAAVESVLKQGSIPLNIKVIFEGEEEIGSPNLAAFIETNKEMLACNYILNPDAGLISADLPAITYGLRGLAYFELRLFGPSHDLHSGGFGGAIHNPAQALCEVISKMHDENGRITLPGFYNKVVPLSAEERKEIARLPITDEYYKQTTGVTELWGEKEYSAVERIGARPTLEVNGLISGFTGTGSKTVLPAYAMAKISSRLVPDQNPDDVYAQMMEFLKKNIPSTIRWELIKMSGGPPCLINPHLPETVAMKNAMESVWGVAPVLKREGGSIPVVSDMQKILGVESVLTGFGMPEDAIHSPNESQHMPTFHKGIESIIHFVYNLIGKQAIND